MVKKILLLLSFCFLLSGCYDYNELNKLAIISSIGIDFIDDQYLVTYEVLIDKKESDDSSNEKVYLAYGSAKSISEAFSMATLSISKKPYLEHLKAIVISECIAKDYLKDIVEYLLREPTISNTFHMLVAKDISAHDVLDSAKARSPIIGEKLVTMLGHDKGSRNISSDRFFESIFQDIVDEGKDSFFSTVEKKGEDLYLGGFALLDDYNLVGFLDDDQSLLFNVLIGNAENAIFSNKLENEEIIISAYKSSGGIKYSKGAFSIGVKIDASLIQNHLSLDTKANNTYETLDSNFSKILEGKARDLLNLLISLKSDVLGIDFIYYKNTRIYTPDIWLSLNYDIKIDVNVNKKGFIYEVDR